MRELREGRTTEGFEFAMTLTYAEGADDGAWPDRISGAYFALDGHGEFAIERVALNEWERTDTGDHAVTPDRLLPWVIVEGFVTRRALV